MRQEERSDQVDKQVGASSTTQGRSRADDNGPTDHTAVEIALSEGST